MKRPARRGKRWRRRHRDPSLSRQELDSLFQCTHPVTITQYWWR